MLHGIYRSLDLNNFSRKWQKELSLVDGHKCLANRSGFCFHSFFGWFYFFGADGALEFDKHEKVVSNVMLVFVDFFKVVY